MESKEILQKKEVPLYQFEDSEEVKQVAQMRALGSEAIYDNSKNQKMTLNAYSTIDSSNEKQIQKLLVKQLTISNPEELAQIKAEINSLRAEQQYRNEALNGLVMADRLSVSKRDLGDRKKAAKKAAKNIKNAEKYKELFEKAKNVKDKVSYLKKRRAELMTAQEKIGAAYGDMDEFEKVQIDIAKCKENLKIREDLAKLYSECKSQKERGYVDAEINKINAENSALTASVMEITNSERQYEISCDEKKLTDKEKERNERCEKNRNELMIGTMRTQEGRRYGVRSLFQDVQNTDFSSLNSIKRMENAVRFMLVYAKKELRLKAKFLSEKEANVYANLSERKSMDIKGAGSDEVKELKRMVSFGECIRVLKSMYQRKDYVGIRRIRTTLFKDAEIRFDNYIEDSEKIQKIAELQTYTDSVVYNEGKRYWGKDYVNEIMNKKDRKESATDKELETEEQILQDSRNAYRNRIHLEKLDSYEAENVKLEKKYDDLKKELSDLPAKQSKDYERKLSELNDTKEKLNDLHDKIKEENDLLRKGFSVQDEEKKLEESYLKSIGYEDVTDESIEEYNKLLTEENEERMIGDKGEYIDKVRHYENRHKADVERGQLIMTIRDEYLRELNSSEGYLPKEGENAEEKAKGSDTTFVPQLKDVVRYFSGRGLDNSEILEVYRGILSTQINLLEKELNSVHMEMKWEEDTANAGPDEGYSEEDKKAATEKLKVLKMKEKAVKDGITGSREMLEKVRIKMRNK